MHTKFGSINGNARATLFQAARAPQPMDIVDEIFQRQFMSYQHVVFYECNGSAIWSAESTNYIALNAAKCDAIDEHEIMKGGLAHV